MLSLFNQAGFEHTACALIDAVVERGAAWIEAKPQNAEAAQRVAPLLPQFRHFVPRGQADLDRTNQLGEIVGVDFFSGRAIETPENSVEMIGAAVCGAIAQALTQLFLALRAGEEAFKQGAQV